MFTSFVDWEAVVAHKPGSVVTGFVICTNTRIAKSNIFKRSCLSQLERKIC